MNWQIHKSPSPSGRGTSGTSTISLDIAHTGASNDTKFHYPYPQRRGRHENDVEGSVPSPLSVILLMLIDVTLTTGNLVLHRQILYTTQALALLPPPTGSGVLD